MYQELSWLAVLTLVLELPSEAPLSPADGKLLRLKPLSASELSKLVARRHICVHPRQDLQQ